MDMNSADNHRNKPFDNGSYLRLIETIKEQAFHSGPIAVIGTSDKERELVARALHYIRTSSFGIFIESDSDILNLSAYSDSLQNPANKRSAEHCTLYIDKIDQYNVEQQEILIGIIKNKPSIKVIISSNQSFDLLIDSGRLAIDLFDLISSPMITIPPQRRRPFDLINLLIHLHSLIAKQDHQIHSECQVYKKLCSLLWPGSKDELDKTLQAISILHCDISTS